jgi:hypothetical protein
MTDQQSEQHRKNQRIRFPVPVQVGFVLLLIGVPLLVYLSGSWVILAANAANPLRALIGNQGVARLETYIFELQDRFHQWEYQSGRKQASSPWQVEASGSPFPSRETAPALEPTSHVAITAPTPVPLGDGAPLRTSSAAVTAEAAVIQVTPTAAGAPVENVQINPAESLEVPPSPTSEPVSAEWILQPAAPFGTVAGEGAWEPYITTDSGRMIAARTFLQPDKERPFAYVAAVAFDLQAVRLNFVIGFDEPSEKGGPKGQGIIPPEDLQAGILLAAFNGGFQSTHGGYGAMQAGFIPLAPQPEAATVAIYPDGLVQIGEWGADIDPTGDMAAYRQNCRMILHNGEVSPRVFNNSTVDWGGTVDNQIVTWRSGIGISEDGRTLFYFAGPSLSMPALADAMLAAGAYQSMLLDINAFWVHFAAVRVQDGVLESEPLLPKDMIHNVDRFLKPFPRDFFYITLRSQK